MIVSQKQLYPSCPIQGGFQIVELPSDLPIVNEIETNPPPFEKRWRIPKPYTPAILIERRIYVLAPLTDPVSHIPFFAYYYIGSLPESAILNDAVRQDRIGYTFTISRNTYSWPFRFITKSERIGRTFPFKTGGFEFFLAYGQDGLSGSILTRDYIHGRDTSPMNIFYISRDPIQEIIQDAYMAHTT